jgi:cell division protein FtsQ
MQQAKTKRKTAQPIQRSWLLCGFGALLAAAAVVLLGMEYLPVRDVEFSGNQHLKTEELQALVGLQKGGKLFGVSTSGIRQRLMRSPWVKEAVVRKDLTGRITARIVESMPIAILAERERHFLVDRDGVKLEDLKDEPVYFLPVIRIDADAAPEAYREAIAFATVIFDKKAFTYNGMVELTGARPEDLTMVMDRIPVMIGAGDFVRKLERLRFVRDEISRRNLTVEYIDVRFVDKVIVKPVGASSSDTSGKKQAAKTRTKIKDKKKR